MKTLKDTNHMAYDEWMSKNTKNVDEVSYGSKFKAWFKCRKCGHEWQSMVCNRSKGKGCLACTNRVVNKNNRFSEKFPELILDWDPSNKKTPDKYVFGSNALVGWICHVCGYIWKARIVDRVNGSGCACYAGQTVNKYNRLSDLCKRSLDDWDYEKNDDVPENFAYKSNKKVYWKCKKCKHMWFSQIRAYVNSSGCQKCSGFLPNMNNCLATDLFLVRFYNDSVSPTEIHKRSAKKVWWKCKKCKFKWFMSPHMFSNYRGCPKCDSGSKVSKSALQWIRNIDKDALPEQKIKIDDKYIYVDGLNKKKIPYMNFWAIIGTATWKHMMRMI